MKLAIFGPILVASGMLVAHACDKGGNVKTEVSEVEPAPADPVFVEPPPAEPEPAQQSPEPELPQLDKTEGTLTWFSTCGDPVCSGYSGPWPGVPGCGPNKAGDPCSTEGATCDPKSNCNARLICATEDPKRRPGGCPISRARYKRDIAYIGDAEREAYYRELQALKLATYRYRGRSDDKLELGVMLEDAEQREHAVWADPANDRVDLYGYASLAIAGVQAQARELELLRGELASLRDELDRVRRQAARCDPEAAR